jgi:hypothetical protein
LAIGKLRLSGDLSGTASNPTVPALQFKEDLSNKSANIQVDAASYSKYPSVKAVKDYVDQATLGIALQVTLDGPPLLQMLRQIEYSKWNEGTHVCPVCNANFHKYGHETYCKLIKTINELEEKCLI